jgi:hypothetical protein
MRQRALILRALLRAMESRAELDAIVWQSQSDEELYRALARPPFSFSSIEAGAVLMQSIGGRTPRREAELRAELDRIEAYPPQGNGV